MKIALEPTKPSVRDVGPIKDVKDEEAEEGCNKVEIDFSEDWDR